LGDLVHGQLVFVKPRLLNIPAPSTTKFIPFATSKSNINVDSKSIDRSYKERRAMLCQNINNADNARREVCQVSGGFIKTMLRGRGNDGKG